MPRRPVPSRSSLLKSPEFVRLALAGVEQEIEQARQRLATLQAYATQLRAGVKGAVPAPAAAAPAARPAKKAKRGSNRLSPAARKALSERMKRKWAEFRKAKDQAAGKSAKKAPSKGQAAS